MNTNNNNNNKSDENNDHSDGGVIIIAGAGIVGLCTAYFLAKNHKRRSILVDWTGQIAPGASGKAAGFLVRNWNDGTSTEALTRRSFDLHYELATNVFEGGPEQVQYRRLSCASITTRTKEASDTNSIQSLESSNDNKRKRNVSKRKKTTRNQHHPNTSILEWLKEENLQSANLELLDVQDMGGTDDIAQVTPRLFCNQLWQELLKMGLTTLQKGKVVGPVYDDDDKKNLQFVGAKLEDGTIVHGNALLYACGPWTANIMYGIKGHGISLPTSPNGTLNQVLFCYNNDDEFSIDTECEIFVRPNQTAFCTALPGDMVHVTETPGNERIDADIVRGVLERVQKNSGNILGSPNKQHSLDQKDDHKHEAHQDSKQKTSSSSSSFPVECSACYQPVTEDFLPVLGKLSKRAVGIRGGSGPKDDDCSCYIASGNNCWGILLGPVTGECMADLIVTGKSNIDLTPFRPSRFRNLKVVA